MFFLVRELSLTLMQEEETQLPLSKDKDCVKIDNILDLSKFYIPYFIAYKTEFFPSKTIPKSISILQD